MKVCQHCLHALPVSVAPGDVLNTIVSWTTLVPQECCFCFAGVASDQCTPEAALNNDLASSSDDEESVDVCLGHAPANAPDTAMAAPAASQPMAMAGSKPADLPGTPAATAPAESAAGCEPEASIAASEHEAAALRPDACGSSAAAGTSPDAVEVLNGHEPSVTCQVTETAATPAAEGPSEAVQRVDETGAQTRCPEDQQAQDSGGLNRQSVPTTSAPAAAQSSAVSAAHETTPTSQPVDVPAVNDSSPAEQQAPASDVAKPVQDGGSSHVSSHISEEQHGSHERQAEVAVAPAAAEHTLPSLQMPSADDTPEASTGSLPSSSPPQQAGTPARLL